MDKGQQRREQITDLLAQILELPADSVASDAHLMKDLGGDSWQYLEFRTELERVFGITIPDEEVDRLGTVDEAVKLLSERLAPRDSDGGEARASSGSVPKKAGLEGEAFLGEDGAYYVDLELAAHHLGRCNLSETPFMKLLNHIRWMHLHRLSGVPGRRFVDEQNQRLYPSFYYVEVKFPRQTPMASYGEEDRFTIVNTLGSFGNSLMDGFAFFYPASWPAEKKIPLKDGRQAEELGIPYARTSNLFVEAGEGPDRQERPRPAQPGLDRIPKMAEVPDSYVLVKKADREDGFGPPPAHFSSITREPLEIEYPIDPDRDINGVGLLSFASYCTIQDYAERRLLPEKPVIPIEHVLLNDRTVVSRRSAYLGGARQEDTIVVSIDAWLENPFLSDHPAPEMAPVRLHVNCEMVRRSDGERVLLSGAEKVVFGRTLEDAGLLEPLKKLAG